MNLYEKVTAFLKLNKVREKDIVMAHKYTQKRILIIAPDLLKKSFQEYNYDDIDFDNMVNFTIFGLDYITQKAWILPIFGDITTWKFFRIDIGYCKEFFANNTTQKLLRDKIDEHVNELANDFQVNNTNTRLVKVLSEYFKYMLNHGIHLAPSQFEAMFLSDAHTEEEIACVLELVETYIEEKAGR